MSLVSRRFRERSHLRIVLAVVAFFPLSYLELILAVAMLLRMYLLCMHAYMHAYNWAGWSELICMLQTAAATMQLREEGGGSRTFLQSK